MKYLTLLKIGVSLLSVLVAGLALADPPKVGDVAPDFSLPGSDGKTHKLSDYKGKNAIVLAWFPKAFTGG